MNNIKDTYCIYIYILCTHAPLCSHVQLCTQVSPSFLLARLLNTAPSLGPFLRRDLISNLRLMLRGCTGWAAKYGFAKHGIGTYGIILFICRE